MRNALIFYDIRPKIDLTFMTILSKHFNEPLELIRILCHEHAKNVAGKRTELRISAYFMGYGAENRLLSCDII